MKKQCLSNREKEYYFELLLGKTNKQIAEKLCVAEKTVKWQNTMVFRKLNVKSARQLLALVIDNQSKRILELTGEDPSKSAQDLYPLPRGLK